MDQTLRDQAREMVQNAAYRAWENSGRKGTIVMATGVGKSKLAIRRIMQINTSVAFTEAVKFGILKSPCVLLVTPTEKLRDKNWPAEFEKWGTLGIMEKLVKRVCFASLKNEKGNRYKLVILDEIHRLTELSAEGFRDGSVLTQFLADNMAEEVMGLTATEPDPTRDRMKADIIAQIAPVCFRYTLDEAVADGILPPYQVKVIMVPLDRISKNIKGGTVKTPFMTTEVASYEYMNKMLKKALMAKKKNPGSKWAESIMGQRFRFIAELPSKTRIADKLIQRIVHQEGKRTLIFCGGIDQSRDLCGINVYNSSPEDKKRDMLEAFKNGYIDYLGVVNAVNEGHNIPGIQRGIIVQLNSNERDVIQRLGRVLRGDDPLVYIIVAQGTQDEKWMTSALSGLDPKRISYESYLNYLT